MALKAIITHQSFSIAVGTNPFLANWQINGVNFSKVKTDHRGEDLLKGITVFEIPFL